MGKLNVLLKAPVLTLSGYGVHSRQIFRSLVQDSSYEVFVEATPWGDCSFINEEIPERNKIRECYEKLKIAKFQNKVPKFDIFVHVTIPNEFERLGQFNVGVTAGIETNQISGNWVKKCEEMDLIIVPSEHSRKVMVESPLNWENPQTGERGTYYLKKPVVVCHEGVNTDIFKKMTAEEFQKVEAVASLKFDTDFNFLHVGQWGGGGFGEDRKNIAFLVKYFIEEFFDRKDTGLVLKVNMARNSMADYESVKNRLQQIKSNYPAEKVPPIYLLHASFSDAEMAALYNHPQIKVMVSLTHGEGFGLPLLESAACDLPVVATNWSGHLDFLREGKFVPVAYDLKEIPQAAEWGDILIKGSKWAEVSEEDAKRRMGKIRSAYSKPKEWAHELGEEIRKNFNVSTVCEKVSQAIKHEFLQVASAQINPVEHCESLIDTPESYNVLYTMPRSSGDVFISTAVIDGLMKTLPENSKIYFATSPQYADILEDNPNIHKLVQWYDFMLSPEITEQAFDLVLTPDTATQYTFSNFVKKGQGRLLAEEYANHCQCELGNYFIKKDYKVAALADSEYDYVTFHPGSGKGQWGSRRYDDWQEVINNLKDLFLDLKIVQVGSGDEPSYEGIDVDLRGKTNVHQLAAVISESKMHLSIDTFTMHLAASYYIPIVAIFGCSHAQSTGPWAKDKEKSKFYLIESTRETGCYKRACYKPSCSVNPENPPINEIDSQTIVDTCSKLLKSSFKENENHKHDRIFKKISGYTTTYNVAEYPFIESIKSMLGFCDEVVVVDGCSTDGTYEALQKLAETEPKLALYQREWDFSEPGMDGAQKAYARLMCSNEFLWQQDADEVVHEKDYEKIKMLAKRFPKNVDILHLPVVELWGNGETVTGRRHAWKWRLSRNSPDITHNINKNARLVDEKTGKVYAKPGMSDGCEYVHSVTYEMLPHSGFWSTNFELARVHMSEQYAEGINAVFDKFPSVYHYSWCSLENKVKQFKTKWDRQWSALYKTENVVRFPGVDTEEQVKELAKKLYEQGGEDNDPIKYKFALKIKGPAVMEEWLSKVPLNKE